MKNLFKNLLLITLILLLVVFLTGCQNKEKKIDENDRNELTNSGESFYYKIENDTYAYNLFNNEISIKYPILISDELDLTETNNLIRNTALNIFKIDEDFEQTIDVDYTIKYQSPTFISIVFTGLIDMNLAAHPTLLFYSLNIDLKNNSKIKLTDIYNIDSNFIDRYIYELNNQIDPDIILLLENYSTEELVEMFMSADYMEYGIFSYYTDTSVGISFPAMHAIGDHIEVEINKDFLKNNLK